MEHLTTYNKDDGRVIGSFKAATKEILDKQVIPEGAAVYEGKVEDGHKIDLTTKKPVAEVGASFQPYDEVVVAEIAKRKAHVLVSGTEAEIHSHIDEEITDLNSAKGFLKDLITHFHLMNR